MEKKNLDFSVDLKELKQRFCVADVKDYLDRNRQRSGKILVLYGLRRTGKTTIIQQILNEYKDKPEYHNKCAFFEVHDTDTMNDIYKVLMQEKERNTKLICIDEITNAKDFVTNTASLANSFAKFYGMQIIIAGTDSLKFYFANERELFDRIIKVQTTHISYAEHNYLFGTTDIDEYIKYGGLLKDINEEYFIHNYHTATEYIKKSVTENLIRSIRKNIRNSELSKLSEIELITIIEKIVEEYSGRFNIDIMQEPLLKVKINIDEDIILKNKELNEKEKEKYIDTININREFIVNDFLKEIQANSEIKTEITDNMVNTLNFYLNTMDVLSTTEIVFFNKNKNGLWNINKREYESYIIQPAIKYFHLLKGIEFIKEKEFYKEFSPNLKKILLKKLTELIQGDMLEQIITFNVNKDLNSIQKNYNNRYLILKPKFTIENKISLGEYDLLICNNVNDNIDDNDEKNKFYYAFEIKHTKNITPKQYKTLINNDVMDCINSEYGERKIAAVLYRGISYINEDNILYFNVSDFLIAVNKYKDMDLVINHLIRNLMYNKNIFYKGIISNFESKIENYKKYTSNINNEIDFFEFCKNIISENPFEFLYIINNNLPLEPKSLLKNGNEIYYESRLDYYIELVDIAINLQPILLEKVNFNSVIFSSLIKEQHYNFYMNLCEKAVNKLPLTIKNVKYEYFFDKEKNIDNQEKYIKLWEFAINKDTNLIKYLNNSNIKNNDYLNLFFQAYKKDKNIEKYFDNEKLPNHYQNKDELFQKFNELINKNNTDYEFTKK